MGGAGGEKIVLKVPPGLFPTIWLNATKFGVIQILMAITLASIRKKKQPKELSRKMVQTFFALVTPFISSSSVPAPSISF